MKSRTKNEDAVFMGLFGAVFFIVGLWMLFSSHEFKNHAIEVTGIVTKIDKYDEWDGNEKETHYDVYVAYKIDGSVYETMINSYSYIMKEGKPIKLYVDKGNPNIARSIETDNLIGYVSLAMGTFIILLSVKTILQNRKIMKNNACLKSAGERRYVTITRKKEVKGYTVNGKHPFEYICEDSDGNTYVSDCYFDSRLRKKGITIQIGMPAMVYVDRENEKNYFVDLFGEGIV